MAEEDDNDEESSSEDEEDEDGVEDGDDSGESPPPKRSVIEATGLKMSAAGLCVHMGSFSDPPDIPGLAHFLGMEQLLAASLTSLLVHQCYNNMVNVLKMGRKIVSYILNDTYFPTILAEPDPEVFSGSNPQIVSSGTGSRSLICFRGSKYNNNLCSNIV